MVPFSNFILEASVYLLIVSASHAALKAKLTHPLANRWLFLLAILLTVGLPFLPWQMVPYTASHSSGGYEVLLTPLHVGAETVTGPWLLAQDVVRALLLPYLIGVMLFSILFLYRLSRLAMLINGAKIVRFSDFTLCEVAQENTAASLFRFVLLSESCPASHREFILRHELAHVRGLHSIDLILAEALCTLFWFHPASWYLRKAIKENHEYLADAASIAQGEDKIVYCEVLLAEALDVHHSTLQHRFAAKAALNKRIERMLTDEKQQGTYRYLWLLPVLTLALLVHACTHDTTEAPPSAEVKMMHLPQMGQKDSTGVYTLVEKMPEFKGGMDALMLWLGKNIHYPASAKAESAEGTVFLSFVVGTEGNVYDIQILHEDKTDPRLAQAAVAALSHMPNWLPGEHEGQKVEVKFNLPVRFALD